MLHRKNISKDLILLIFHAYSQRRKRREKLLLYPSLLLLHLKNISRSDPRLAVAYWAAEFLHVKSAGDFPARLPWPSALHAGWQRRGQRPTSRGSCLDRARPCFIALHSLFILTLTVKILSDNLNKVVILRYKSARLPLLLPPSYIGE